MYTPKYFLHKLVKPAMLLLPVVALLGLSACGSGSDSKNSATKEQVKLAATMTLDALKEGDYKVYCQGVLTTDQAKCIAQTKEKDKRSLAEKQNDLASTIGYIYAIRTAKVALNDSASVATIDVGTANPDYGPQVLTLILVDEAGKPVNGPINAATSWKIKVTK